MNLLWSFQFLFGPLFSCYILCVFNLTFDLLIFLSCLFFLEWRTQLRWICDVITHNFKWRICDFIKTKMSYKALLWCGVWFLHENTDLLKNKLVSTFLSENLISTKSRSREVFGQNSTQFPYFHSLRLTYILESLSRRWCPITALRYTSC